MNQNDRKQLHMNERKAWATPSVRSVVPARRTRGGFINSNQETMWYSVS